MKFNAQAPGGGIEAKFSGIEVQTVSRAFKENAERLRALGNDSSVSEYQEWVAGWTGKSQTYRGPSTHQLIEPIQYFLETTEDKVDELLDTCPRATRIKEAGRRYELAYKAACIIAELEAKPGEDFQFA